MNFKTYALLTVALLTLLAMSGCVTTGRETIITGFQKTHSFESKKVTVSLPIVVEKNMETKKDPDATERAVAEEVYINLKKNLARNNVFSLERSENILDIELKVHYVNRYSAGFEYSTTWHPIGGQIVVARVNLKMDGQVVAQIDSFNNTGTLLSKEPLVREIADDLTAQIEKILKEGIALGKTQSP